VHSDALWESWADLLADQGYVVIDQFLPAPILAELLAFFKAKQDELTPARVGALGERQQLSDVRSDLTFWLDKPRDTALASVFSWIEESLQRWNRLLFLSLSGYEFHLAYYPTGGITPNIWTNSEAETTG